MDVMLYARLSEEDDDPTLELTGTQRQLRELRTFAEGHGHRIIREYEDAAASAYDPKRKRPAFQAMLADLEHDAESIGAILCWKLDRLLRKPREGEDLLDLAERRGIGIVSLHDTVDLVNPTGRLAFRIGNAMAIAESETISLRQREKARAIAETGRASGGGIRPFGLRRLRDARGDLVKPPAYEVVEPEAALVREASERILAGDSLSSIVLDWDARGIRTPGCKAAPKGRRWEVSSLKRMLSAPRIVGDRVHHGRVTGSGHIPALLDRPTWERLRVALSVRRGRPGRVTRSHFLTGLATCGLCGSRLQPVQRAEAGDYRYSCRRPRGCGRLSVLAKHIEPLIAEMIALRLDSPEFQAAVAAVTERDGRAVDLEQLKADEQALEDLNRARFIDRIIPDTEYRPLRAELVDRIDTARLRLSAATQRSPLASISGLDVRARWAEMDATRQHEVAAALMERVEILPSPTGGRTFDPARCGEPVWRV